MSAADTWSLRAAAFVIQVLELDLAADELAAGLAPLKREAAGGITAVELASSVGSTPFLVYHYPLPGGGERFRGDVATMERAAALGTPGPRIVASATTDDAAFVLATTPNVQRMLSGEQAGTTSLLPEPALADRRRRETPGKLMDAVRAANALAGEWLGALRVAAESSADAVLALTDEEAALALYLLDPDSAADLLRALNLALAAARGETAAPEA